MGKIALYLNAAETDRPRPGEAARNHIAGTVGQDASLVLIGPRGIEPQALRYDAVAGVRGQDAALRNDAVRTEQTRVERRRGALELPIGHAAVVPAAASENEVIQHGARARLSFQQWFSGATQVVELRQAAGVGDGDIDALPGFVIAVGNPWELGKGDLVFRPISIGHFQMELLQLLALCAQSPFSVLPERADEAAWLAVEQHFQLQGAFGSGWPWCRGGAEDDHGKYYDSPNVVLPMSPRGLHHGLRIERACLRQAANRDLGAGPEHGP